MCKIEYRKERVAVYKVGAKVRKPKTVEPKQAKPCVSKVTPSPVGAPSQALHSLDNNEPHHSLFSEDLSAEDSVWNTRMAKVQLYWDSIADDMLQFYLSKDDAKPSCICECKQVSSVLVISFDGAPFYILTVRVHLSRFHHLLLYEP